METKEIRSLSREELLTKLNDLKQEFFNLRCQHGIGQLEKTSILSIVRKKIARVNTVLREKELSKG